MFCVYVCVFFVKAATGKHFVAMMDAAHRKLETAEARLAQTTQEHKALAAAVDDLKKRRDAAKEAYRCHVVNEMWSFVEINRLK